MNPAFIGIAVVAAYFLFKTGAVGGGLGAGSTKTPAQLAAAQQQSAVGNLLGGLIKGLSTGSTVAKAAGGNPTVGGSIGSTPGELPTTTNLAGLPAGTTLSSAVPGTGSSVQELQNLGYTNSQISGMINNPMSSAQTTGDLSASITPPDPLNGSLYGQTPIGTSIYDTQASIPTLSDTTVSSGLSASDLSDLGGFSDASSLDVSDLGGDIGDF